MKRALLCAKNIHMHDSEFVFFLSLWCLQCVCRLPGNLMVILMLYHIFIWFYAFCMIEVEWIWNWVFKCRRNLQNEQKKIWNGTPNGTKLWWNKCQIEKKIEPTFELAKATMQVKAINDNGNCLKIINGKYKCFYC